MKSLYKHLIRDVNTARGAPMGRCEYREISPRLPAVFNLFAVPLNAGGYDRGGAYWGHGAPLYAAYALVEDDQDVAETLLFIRAQDRDHAKQEVRKQHKAAQFYR